MCIRPPTHPPSVITANGQRINVVAVAIIAGCVLPTLLLRPPNKTCALPGGLRFLQGLCRVGPSRGHLVFRKCGDARRTGDANVLLCGVEPHATHTVWSAGERALSSFLRCLSKLCSTWYEVAVSAPPSLQLPRPLLASACCISACLSMSKRECWHDDDWLTCCFCWWVRKWTAAWRWQ